MGLFSIFGAEKPTAADIAQAEKEFNDTLEARFKSVLEKYAPKEADKEIDLKDINHNRKLIDEVVSKFEKILEAQTESSKAKDAKIDDLLNKIAEQANKDAERSKLLEQEALNKKEQDAKAFVQKLIDSKKIEKDNTEKTNLFENEYKADAEKAQKLADMLPTIGGDDKAPGQNFNSSNTEHTPLGSIVPVGIAKMNENIQPFN